MKKNNVADKHTEDHVINALGTRLATTKDMESYIQPTIERAPSNVILHCGTYDLKTSTDPEQFAENMINLTKSMKTDKK